MKIMNIGILAHVDAGKTTLTESMLYASGTIAESGRVDRGSTITDSMALEKQRGITIQASIASYQWGHVKVNLIDTPGHIDFYSEVERSLNVLDGAILLISAKDGIQAQTRILFDAIRKRKLPALIFINKIDQPDIDFDSLYEDIRAKLSSHILIMQSITNRISLLPKTLNPLSEEFKDTIIETDDALLKKYVMDQPITAEELLESRRKNINDGTLLPVYHGSALKHIGTKELMDAILMEFTPFMSPPNSNLAALVYKVERDDNRNKRTYMRIFGGSIKSRDVLTLQDHSDSIKIKKLETSSNGKMVETEKVECGDIAIFPNEMRLKIGDSIGTIPERNLILHNNNLIMQVNISPVLSSDRTFLLEALSELAETDPLLQYKLDSRSNDIIMEFLGKVQMEVIVSLLQNRYHLQVNIENVTTIYKERPLKKADFTAHIEVTPNPFWASIGLSIEPLPIGTGLRYESKVSYGYLNKSFQNAVEEGVRYGCEQGLYGWEVTDLKVCFEYGVYYSPVSTPADFRHLAPIVFEQALKQSGTELLEPCLSFELYVPQDCNARVYNDLKKFHADIVSIKTQHNEVVVSGKIPARTSQFYKEQLSELTKGRGVFLTERAGYQQNTGETFTQARKPDDRLDKTRHFFDKSYGEIGNEGHQSGMKFM
jgi:ribosomal protection tetracycline resistance protein